MVLAFSLLASGALSQEERGEGPASLPAARPAGQTAAEPVIAPAVADISERATLASVQYAERPLVLTPGERLVYDIRWSGMPAGQATLSVKWLRKFEEAECYHIESTTRSNGFLKGFTSYAVDDEAVSIVDAAGGYSRFFKMAKNEGHIHQTERILFDYERGLAVYEQDGTGPHRERSSKLVRMDGRVQDALSCLYYLRTLALSPGQAVVMPVHTAKRQWTLTVDILKREELDIPGFGKLATLRVEPDVKFPGIFVRKGRMSVWLEETTHIPVLMLVDVPIGSVTVTLVDAENSPLRPAKARREQ
jgi:hypothetical protein